MPAVTAITLFRVDHNKIASGSTLTISAKADVVSPSEGAVITGTISFYDNETLLETVDVTSARTRRARHVDAAERHAFAHGGVRRGQRELSAESGVGAAHRHRGVGAAGAARPGVGRLRRRPSPMGAVDGLKVVEAGLLVQAPQAAATLAEWGAEVIKVELPGFGDQARWLPVQPGDRRSAYFSACNRGKRSVTVDLRTPPGREIFLRLVEWADVVLTNFVPGTMERWGLDYDTLAGRNPRVVYASASTYGSVGVGRDPGGRRPRGPGGRRPHQHHRRRRR